MSDPTTPAKPRKGRRKATTDLGAQILRRERQRLAREEATLGEALANEARNASVNRNLQTQKIDPVRVGINRGIVRRVGAVLASEGVNVPIHVRPADERTGMRAWTDFGKIDVTYRNHEDVRLVAATLRGLLYHEGGHCRWTVPFQELTEMVKTDLGHIPTAPGHDSHQTLHRAWNCLEDQRMETAVVSDSPRKAAYFTPLVMTEHCATLDNMAANYPLLVWRRYLPERIREEARRMFVVRHGSKGASLVQRLNVVVTSYVMATDAVTMWNAIVEYHQLLQEMRPLASHMDDAGHGRQYKRPLASTDDDILSIPVDPGMEDGGVYEGEGTDGEDDETVVDTTDPTVAQHLTEILIAAWNDPSTLVRVQYVDSRPQAPEQSEDEGGEQGESGGPGDLSTEPEQEPGDSDQTGDTGEGEDDDAPQGDADNGGSKDDAPEESSDGAGEGAGSHDSPMSQDDLDDLLQAVEDEMTAQRELDGDVEAFADALHDRTSMLDTYIGGVCDDGELIGQAEWLAEEIERSFHTHTMDREPAWVEGQRRGVLNVLRYETRQAGDVEYFRQWTEDEQPGYDISVSILLDYSGSMHGSQGKLAQAGYAAKLACQNLGIPCTVTLFDHGAVVLWDAQERAEHMVTITPNGGTDPTVALADLDNQRMERSKHLVLIMTDGEWNDGWPSAHGHVGKRKDARHLAFYKDGGRRIIGLGYVQGGYNTEALVDGLAAKGCDESWAVSDLMEIPRLLESALLDMA